MTWFLPSPSPGTPLSLLSPLSSAGVQQSTPSLSFSRPELLKRHTTPNDTFDVSSLRSLEPKRQIVVPRKLRKHSSSGVLNDFKVHRWDGGTMWDHSSLVDDRARAEEVERGNPSSRAQQSFHPFNLASHVLDAFGFPGDFQPKPKVEALSKTKKLEAIEDRSFLPFEVTPRNEALFSQSTSGHRNIYLRQGRKAKRETMILPIQAPPPHMAFPVEEENDDDMDKYDDVGWEMIPSISSRVPGLSSIALDPDINENEIENTNRNRNKIILDPYSDPSWSSPNSPPDLWSTPTLRIGSDHPFHSHLSGWRGMEDVLATDVSVREVEEKAMQELESISSVLGVKQPVPESENVGGLSKVSSIDSTCRSVRSWRQALKSSRCSPVIQTPPPSGNGMREDGLVAERSTLSPSFTSRSTNTHLPPLTSNIVNWSTRPPVPPRSTARGVPPKLNTRTSTERVAEKVQLRSPISLPRQEVSHSFNASPTLIKSTLKMPHDGIPIHQRPLPPLPAKAQSKTFFGSKPLARFLRSRGLSTSSDPTTRRSNTSPVSPSSVPKKTQSPISVTKAIETTTSMTKEPRSPTAKPLRHLSARDEPPARLPSHNRLQANSRRHDDLHLTAFSFLALNDPDNLSEPDMVEPEKEVVQHILPPQELSRIMDDHRARRREEIVEVEDEKSIRSTKADAGGWSSDEERYRAVRGSMVEPGWRSMKQRAEVQLKLDVGVENLARHALSSLPRNSSLSVDRSGTLKRHEGFSILPGNEGDREVLRGSLPAVDRRRRGPVPPARPMPRSTPPAMTLATTTAQRIGSVSLSRHGMDKVGAPQRDSPELQLSINLDNDILDLNDECDSRPSSTGATVGRDPTSIYDLSDTIPTIVDPQNIRVDSPPTAHRINNSQPTAIVSVPQDFGSAFGGSVVAGYQNGIVGNLEMEEEVREL
ncbi:hypothetical protein BCR39DRAFT_107134 [Naematelia encephala]|uniref:Uncharacterized protein n=1 Tax=Naematelia encephala TaxID=71784 RepID=A0A1Y2B800_9TREE|nr:hypothetical protein BCR39DRAFT_107134 [Naematelia encephala]